MRLPYDAGSPAHITSQLAGKKGSWRVYEPVSLDFAGRDVILAKTRR
jgi:hypothetical protein